MNLMIDILLRAPVGPLELKLICSSLSMLLIMVQLQYVYIVFRTIR